MKMSAHHTRARSLSIAVFAALASLPANACSQTPRTRALPPNVVTGVITGLDKEAATIKIKSKTGAEATYRYTEKTLALRANKGVEVGAFLAGESIVARFRKSSVGPPSLYDLTDPASWSWLDRIRHETTAVTVIEADERVLRVTEGADTAQFNYRITEKTTWSRAGKPSGPASYKAGDRAWVVPRLLPSGATMAIAVSDAPAEAAKLKERARSVLSATVVKMSATDRKLIATTAAGEQREFVLAADCIVRRSGKDVPVSTIKPRQSITLHLTRDESGEKVVRRVTIKSTSSGAKPNRETEAASKRGA